MRLPIALSFIAVLSACSDKPAPTLAQPLSPIPVAVAAAVDTSARYAYDGKGYRLVEGSNPLRDE